MLTTCPNCSHVFSHSGCCEVQQSAPTLMLSATLQLTQRANAPAACTVSINQPKGGLGGMAGGGIVLTNSSSGGSVILQQQEDWTSVRVPASSPQPSPSNPLSFVLPASNPAACTVPSAASKMQVWQFPLQPSMFFPPLPPEVDLERIAITQRRLRACGWYYEGLSWQESIPILKNTAPGTFLVRDSSDPRFLFSLSVQTDQGPTSVRLHYSGGRFRLDAVPKMAANMPHFECVLELVEYYVEETKKTKKDKDDGQVWIDALGKLYSNIYLSTPLRKKGHISSLQHLSRLAISRQLKKSSKRHTNPFLHPVSLLPLPAVLLDYMKDYPFTQ